MQRSPSVLSQYNDELDSPDPLATSLNDERGVEINAYGSRKPAPRRSSLTTTKNVRKHTKNSSQSIEVFQSSPFRTVAEQSLSPWKIRVTVEAQPEDEEMEANAPVTRARTRATKIPVQAEASLIERAKSSAGGRKSQGITKRSGTPERKGRNTSRSRRQSVTDLEIIPLGDDAEEDDWLKQKKSPRKKRNTRKATAAPDAEGPKTLSPSQSRSKSHGGEFEIRPDTDTEGEMAIGEPGPAVGSESPELQRLDLNQISIRPRALSTKSKDNDNGDAGGQKPQPPSLQTQLQARKVSANSAMSYPTPSPTSSYHGDSDEVKALDGEPGREQLDEAFDTMLESEGFTMIDLDTLPSAKRYLSSPIEEDINTTSEIKDPDSSTMQKATAQLAKNPSRGIESSLRPVFEQTVAYPILRVDESEILSTAPSSPPAAERSLSLLKVATSRPGLTRKVTPQPYSSPKLPSPPKHEARRNPQHQHRASAGALFAGIALQEIVSPAPSDGRGSSKEPVPSNHSSPYDQDAVFKGFDSGAQRELRAGLRFGEELANRQAAKIPAQSTITASRGGGGSKLESSSSNEKSRSIFDDSDPQPLDGGQASTAPSSNSSRGGGRIMEDTPQTPQNKHSVPPGRTILDTQAKREAEWQLEREAISRQIQNASESQVIVIDSDSEDEDSPQVPQQEEEVQLSSDEPIGDETDIWLAEAKNSSSPPQAAGTNVFSRTEQQRQRERAKEVISRPRRSLTPSPWKRGEDLQIRNEQSAFLSTNLDDMSGLAFHDDSEAQLRFGAGQIMKQQLRQKRNSGKFDIDLMAGTPKKEVVDDSIDTSDVARGDQSMEDEQPLDESDMASCDEENSLPVGDKQEAAGESKDESSELLGATSSPTQPVRIPVNFNDSSMSISTPPAKAQRLQFERPLSGAPASESPPRPPTPRSAMKGTRESFHHGVELTRPDTPTMIRRVVFSGRSRGVDVDGQESSFSMRSSSEDTSFGDEVGRQLRQELHAVEAPPLQPQPLRYEVERNDEEPRRVLNETTAPERNEPATTARQGLSGWIWGSKHTSANTSRTDGQSDINRTQSVPESKMTSDAPVQNRPQQLPDPVWQRTKSSIPSSSRPAEPKSNPGPDLPSYLLAPSYPSDPLRSTRNPLSLSGEFTNAHFRTLHIIYRKSLRPKFHPPPRAQIRQEVWALRHKELTVDESKNGLVKGEFVWTVGDGEVEVLERFMQECEFSNGWFMGKRVMVGDRVKEVKWGWTASELCERLCRIVVGEVVREEERKAREKNEMVK